MNNILTPHLNRFAFVGLAAAIAVALLAPAPARATPYVVTLVQQGPNVLGTGSGAFDLTGLTQAVIGTVEANVQPGIGGMGIGAAGNADVYSGTMSGPSSYGTGGYGFTLASSSTGDTVGLDALFSEIFVPLDYVSGTALSSTMTFDDATLASLDTTPGTYVWTWGTGPDQSFTLIVGGGVSVPEPAALGMFGFGMLLIGAFVGSRRRAP